MPINEFDSSVRPEYVSNRIQLPFAEIHAMAANQQNQYDKAVDDTYKLNDFMSAIPEVNDPMLGLDNTKAKKAIDDEYAPVLNDLSTRIVNGNDPNAIRELTLLQRKIQNDPRIIGLKNQRAQYELYKSDITEKAGKYDARLDDYAGTQLVDDSGNPLPFNYHGMEDSLDREKKFREAMGDFKESTKGWDIESLGADGIKIGQKGQRSGITLEQVMNVAKSKAFTVLKQSDEGRQFEKLLRRTNPNITNEQILDEATKAMFSTATNQIFSNNVDGNSVDVTSMWDKKYDEAKAKEDFSRLPMHELPVSTPGEVTNKQALNVFGLGDNRNEDGTLKSDLYEKQNDLPSNYGMTTQGLPGGEQHKIDKVTGSTDTPQNKLVVEYTNLLNTAKAIGLPIPKLKNGSTDFETLQSKMIEAGKNQLINGDVGQGLQAKLAANMTTYYGGDINEKGDVKLSSFMETAKINEIGNNAELKTDEQKRDLVKNGVIKDINFYAEQPGTVVWSSDDGTNIKDYNVYLGEKTLKELTRPTWELTKSFEDNRTTKMNTPEEIKNYTKKQVNLNKAELNITNYLSNKYLSIKDPNVRQQVLDKTKSTLGELNGYKTTGINYSAEKITDGNNKGESRYIFVGKQGTDPYTNQPSDKVMVIDQTSGLVRVQDLNEIQSQESSYIQQVIAPGYKK